MSQVKPGSEGTLRHLLEATVQQVNADLEEPSEDGTDTATEESRSTDEEMTDAFRAFAPDGAAAPSS